MKLKTGFGYLTAGVLLVPILTVILYYSAQKLFSPEPEYISFVKANSNSVGIAGITVPGKGTWQEGGLPPEVSDIVLLEKSGQVLFSSIGAIRKGSISTLLDVVAVMKAVYKKPMFFIQPLLENGNESIRIAVAERGKAPPKPETMASRIAVIILISLVAFTAVFSMLFIRRLKRSIGYLEAATASITKGDLGTSAVIPGGDELADFSRSLDSMRLSLKEEFARRARFVMGVSHDLRTPLSTIRGYAEALRDGMAETGDERRKYSGLILEKAELLGTRIDELIEFTRMERGDWKLTNKPVALGRFLRETAEHAAEDVRLLGKSFEYSVDLPAELLVSMDESQVARVFENLVGNASRYSEDHGCISLKSSCGAFDGFTGRGGAKGGTKESGTGSWVRIELENDGPGIPQEEMQFIFDPFYRGSRSRKGSGFGLGLSVARLIIEEHGWTVSFASRPGSTVCTIGIPHERILKNSGV